MINQANSTPNHSFTPAQFPARQQPWLGAAWKVASFACYSVLNGLARYLSGGGNQLVAPLPVCEIVFFQDLIALVILLPIFLKHFSFKQFNHLPVHLFRGLSSAVAVITWYFALFYLPLADAVAISVVGPLMGVIFAKLLLKEQINKIRFLIIGFCLLLALLIMQTFEVILNQQNNILGLSFVLFSSLCFALAKVSTRYLAEKGNNARFLTLSLLIFIVPVSFIPTVLNWQPVDLVHMPWLFLAGVFTVLAIICVSKALIYSEVSFLAPFDICRFIFNAIIGYFAFTELPTTWALILVAICFGVFSWKMRASVS